MICNLLYESLNQGKNNIYIETVEFRKTLGTVLRSGAIRKKKIMATVVTQALIG